MLRTLRRNPLPLLVAACSALLCACAVASGGPVQLLGVLPPILLVVALACDRYPAERVLLHLVVRRRQKKRPTAAALPAPRQAGPGVARQLLILAASRRLRGPPAALAF